MFRCLGFNEKKFGEVLADQYEHLYEFMELAKPFFNRYFQYELADHELPPRYKLDPASMYNFSFDEDCIVTASMNRYWFYYRRLFGSEHHKNGWLGARKMILELYRDELHYFPPNLYWSYSYYDDEEDNGRLPRQGPFPLECPCGCDHL